MHKLLLVLLLTPLAALPFWTGRSTDPAPVQIEAPAGETTAPVVAATLTGPAVMAGLAADAPSQLGEAAVAGAGTDVGGAAPLELAREPGHLPTGLLLDVGATEEELAAHYAGLPIEELARQAYRIDQVVSAKLDEPRSEDPVQRARLRELSSETDALQHERAWLDGVLKAYAHPEDDGAQVPTAVTLERFVERHRGKDMEDLHVLQVQVQRSYNLLHRRAVDALFDEGSYTVTKSGSNW